MKRFLVALFAMFTFAAHAGIVMSEPPLPPKKQSLPWLDDVVDPYFDEALED